MVSVINIRDMLSGGQEELIRSYLETYSCVAEKDGIRKHLNPDIERFLNQNAIQFARM